MIMNTITKRFHLELPVFSTAVLLFHFMRSVAFGFPGEKQTAEVHAIIAQAQTIGASQNQPNPAYPAPGSATDAHVNTVIQCDREREVVRKQISEEYFLPLQEQASALVLGYLPDWRRVKELLGAHKDSSAVVDDILKRADFRLILDETEDGRFRSQYEGHRFYQGVINGDRVRTYQSNTGKAAFLWITHQSYGYETFALYREIPAKAPAELFELRVGLNLGPINYPEYVPVGHLGLYRIFNDVPVSAFKLVSHKIGPQCKKVPTSLDIENFRIGPEIVDFQTPAH